jgi:hypothetical protein
VEKVVQIQTGIGAQGILSVTASYMKPLAAILRKI